MSKDKLEKFFCVQMLKSNQQGLESDFMIGTLISNHKAELWCDGDKVDCFKPLSSDKKVVEFVVRGANGKPIVIGGQFVIHYYQPLQMELRSNDGDILFEW